MQTWFLVASLSQASKIDRDTDAQSGFWEMKELKKRFAGLEGTGFENPCEAQLRAMNPCCGLRRRDVNLSFCCWGLACPALAWLSCPARPGSGFFKGQREGAMLAWMLDLGWMGGQASERVVRLR